jgi:hypothetical protein
MPSIRTCRPVVSVEVNQRHLVAGLLVGQVGGDRSAADLLGQRPCRRPQRLLDGGGLGHGSRHRHAHRQPACPPLRLVAQACAQQRRRHLLGHRPHEHVVGLAVAAGLEVADAEHRHHLVVDHHRRRHP